uniref:Glycoside hydrolase family 38 N-terminal domain-containing protein n=1 Tax=Acrobeloides nanus TaxID=290746 RepID=A0A914CUR5_9BILA
MKIMFSIVRQDIIPIGVQYIINGIVDHLLKNPNRKFSYAETGYLYRWISDHADTVNQTLVKLVQNGNTLFTGTFYGDYCAPPGFNFDRTWNPSDAIVDNPLFEDYNVNQRLVDFMNYIKLMV